MDEQDPARFTEIEGDRSRSCQPIDDVKAIFSFRTVKERRRLVEMANQKCLCRLGGGTGGSVHGQESRTKVTVELISVILLF